MPFFSSSFNTISVIIYVISFLLRPTLAGFIFESFRHPICNGPAPEQWGTTPASQSCPAWTDNTKSATSTCVTGFGGSDWRCLHRACHCSYDADGGSEVRCQRPAYFLSTARGRTSFAEFSAHRLVFEQELPLDDYCIRHCHCLPLPADMLDSIRDLERVRGTSLDPDLASLDLGLSGSDQSCDGSADQGNQQCQSDGDGGGSGSGSSGTIYQDSLNRCSIPCQGPQICHEARAVALKAASGSNLDLSIGLKGAGCTSVSRCRANPVSSLDSSISNIQQSSRYGAWGSCISVQSPRRRRRRPPPFPYGNRFPSKYRFDLAGRVFQLQQQSESDRLAAPLLGRRRAQAVSGPDSGSELGLDFDEHYENPVDAEFTAVPEPCICNSTYVSLACCASASGVVWEEPELKLGTLDVDDYPEDV